VTTGQGTQNRLVVPPAEQSSQYKELLRRMQNRTGDTSGQEARDFNALRRAQEQGKKAPQPGDPRQPGAIDPPGVAPRTPAAPVRPSPRPNPGDALPPTPAAPESGPPVPTEPKPIASLATGFNSKGLADLLADAERLMKEEKYESAAARFDQAARVVPNNPMVTLGRGIAELGGGNYGRADQTLRRSIGAEPALLMGRYDLNALLGEKRVQALTKDLKEVADTSPKEVRPRLLLAFLAYNTGNGPDADKYVGEALKLTPNDPVLQSMQKTWSVLGGDAGVAPQAPGELNK
jgi:tetratricopeptide (TPR) repeat protein